MSCRWLPKNCTEITVSNDLENQITATFLGRQNKYHKL